MAGHDQSTERMKTKEAYKKSVIFDRLTARIVIYDSEASRFQIVFLVGIKFM